MPPQSAGFRSFPPSDSWGVRGCGINVPSRTRGRVIRPPADRSPSRWPRSFPLVEQASARRPPLRAASGRRSRSPLSGTSFLPGTRTSAIVPFSPSPTATSSTSASLVSIAATVTPRSRSLPSRTFRRRSTCMNCHQMVKKDSAIARPDSGERAERPADALDSRPQAPDYAYFAHHAHVAAGIGCVTCHGRIDEMETVTQMTPLSMSWCLDCHRNPAPHRRPVSEVTNMKWTPPRDVQLLTAQLDRERPVNPPTRLFGVPPVSRPTGEVSSRSKTVLNSATLSSGSSRRAPRSLPKGSPGAR